MIEKDSQFLKIDSRIIFDTTLGSTDKFTYAMIVLNSKDSKCNINNKQLKDICRISDNRTLYKILSNLSERWYITTDDNCIYLNDISEEVIKIDKEIIEYCSKYEKKIQHHSIILLYILEYNFNVDYGYSFISREELSKYLKVNNAMLTNIFNILHEDMICEFCQGEFMSNDISSRTRNRYVPNNIKHKIGEIIDGKRRYYDHIPKEFFFKELKTGRYNITKSDLNKEKWTSINAIVYFIECTGNNELFYKIGITSKSIEKRFENFPYNYIIKHSINTNLYDAVLIESVLKQKHLEYMYIPKIYFGGRTECFTKLIPLYELL
jgi:hypothetical protein